MRASLLENVGLFLVVSVAMLIAAIALILIGNYLKNLWAEHIARVEYRGAQKFGQRLIRDSYWFSEDKPTMELLKKIGEDATLGYGWSVSNIRDVWRHDRSSLLPSTPDRESGGM